jgi:hypothetical protein
MKKVRFISLFVLLTLLLTVSTAFAGMNNNYSAHLSGESTNSTGQFMLKFSKDGQSLSYILNVAHLENTIMAHIHVAAAPGASGPPVLWLYPSAPPPMEIGGYFSGVLASGSAGAGDLVGPLMGMSLDALRTAIEEGRAYVNVHTTEFPGGLINGPLK